MRTSSQKRFGVFAAFFIVATFLIVYAIRFCTPQSIMGSLRIAYGGVTNEAGEILITATNRSRWPLSYYARIEIKDAGFWPPFPDNVPLKSLGKELKLGPYATGSFYVCPPTNGLSWRIWIDYSADTERNESVAKVQRFFEDFGLSNIGYRIPRDYGGRVLLPDSKDPFNRQAD